jgi:homoserine kinase
VLHRHAVEVVAPATSANLGPGFDSLGLALSLYDRLRVRILDAGLDVQVKGMCADEVPRDGNHLVVRAMRAAFAQMRQDPPGLALHCANGIPHGRGLGSSAAAIVGGIVAARALVSDGAERLPDSAALELAASLEGHPDNVAACLLGGLTIAWSDDRSGAGRAIRLDADVRAVVLVPEKPVSTHIARALLPPSVAQRDAAANAGRAALLVSALSGDAALRTSDVLLAATRDWLHQGSRASAMPCTMDLVVRLRERGHAAVVSGAGPSVLVLLAADGDADDVCCDLPDGWHCHLLDVDQPGARVVDDGAIA